MLPNSELFRIEWPQVQLESSEFMSNGYNSVRDNKYREKSRKSTTFT
jgi:hypothetical protein